MTLSQTQNNSKTLAPMTGSALQSMMLCNTLYVPAKQLHARYRLQFSEKRTLVSFMITWCPPIGCTWYQGIGHEPAHYGLDHTARGLTIWSCIVCFFSRFLMSSGFELIGYRISLEAFRDTNSQHGN